MLWKKKESGKRGFGVSRRTVCNFNRVPVEVTLGQRRDRGEGVSSTESRRRGHQQRLEVTVFWLLEEWQGEGIGVQSRK